MKLYPPLLLVVSLLLAPTAALAWQFQSAEPPANAASHSTKVSRRSFLARSPVTASYVASILSTPKTTLALTTDAAKEQWTRSVAVIDKLLQNWPSSGDAIRVELGTQGTTSPLFQIDKALKVLRENTDDIVEYTELEEEFQLTLSRADSMAYSANFAGGSGKPTPPAVYIEKAKKEVESLQKTAKALQALI